MSHELDPHNIEKLIEEHSHGDTMFNAQKAAYALTKAFAPEHPRTRPDGWEKLERETANTSIRRGGDDWIDKAGVLIVPGMAAISIVIIEWAYIIKHWL